jgi:hypothetical protein
MEETAIEGRRAIPSANEEALLKEYYEILKIVGDFDGRLLTVKGWGVTLSLAALSLGFQQSHYGLFLVASLSGLGFWLIEGVMKRHQMRYYFRMREIEVLQYRRITPDAVKIFSSPRIDSSWSFAGDLYEGKQEGDDSPVAISGPRKSYQFVWCLPNVFLPHVVSVLAGLALFGYGIHGSLGSMKW